MAAKKKNGTRGTPKKATALTSDLPTHSDAEKAKALVKYRELGTVQAACRAVGIGRRTWYNWKRDDPAFAALVAEADEDVTDELEEEAHKRAKDSSDTLLIFLLKAKRRAIYGDKQTIVIEETHPRVMAAILAARDAVMRFIPPDQQEAAGQAMAEAWKEAVKPS